uniref:Uncharacterized protein n=1 Tax=Cajanus cajan TaxID=3821 RepID=A0A151SX60_CAJCA|nr:hypothetical protein KK1_014813 [Cajanus cajan]
MELIKLELYKNVEVQWNEKVFEEMKNLRILIIENATFLTALEHFPNSLRVLDWRCCYPSTSLPPYFNPRQVVLSYPSFSS